MSSVLDIEAIRENAASFSVETYHQLLENGSLSKDTELLRGVVINQMTKSHDHNYFANAIFEAIRSFIPENLLILKESSLTLTDSEVEPDLMIVPGPLSLYRNQNPQSAILVIEIAKSSLAIDRAKANIYANGRVERYLIVDIGSATVELYEKPGANGYEITSSTTFDSVIAVPGGQLVISDVIKGDSP